MVPRSRLLVPALALGLALGLGACGMFQARDQLRGHKIDADQMKELVPGTSTRNDVATLVGSPTMRATFDDNTWLYISQITHPRIGGTQAVEDQKTVVLTFDARGVLADIKTKTQADSLPVDVVQRTTPSPGSETSFLQQLFGNIGRFNALGAAPGGSSAGSGPSGGAPKPY